MESVGYYGTRVSYRLAIAGYPTFFYNRRLTLRPGLGQFIISNRAQGKPTPLESLNSTRVGNN